MAVRIPTTAAEAADLSPTERDDGPTPADLRRLARAFMECMTVDEFPHDGRETGLYDVYSQSGSTYTVDVETGVCSCPDYEHNRPEDDDDEFRCKHGYRAEIVDGRRGLPEWADRSRVDPVLRDRLDRARADQEAGR